MLSCGDVAERLDDYVDGALAPEAERELAAHLQGCAACGAEERALRRLLAQAAALPAELAPGRDLWPGIEARLQPPRVLPFARRKARTAWMGAGLALAAAAAAAWVVWLPSAGGPAVRPAASPAATAELRPAAAPGAAGLDAARAEYDRATRQLLEALEAQGAGLPPETLASVRQNLATIDTALGEIRSALAKDPGNVQLARLLNNTQRRRGAVLQQVVRLTRT